MGMFLSAYHIFRLNVYINVLCCFSYRPWSLRMKNGGLCRCWDLGI
ncbi:hypothetical protein CIPAW_09G085800 [Carya illinoinensis]|uniref:Uncharacterized protein n=1 Tax=Carya illinoinensis TaxID=32201 RepID=A0A8T1PJA0_CARIL|nr:hypothetical protein CIPAW_09G085800 [Carya illinoinensis]